jgi:hypothetical protein
VTDAAVSRTLPAGDLKLTVTLKGSTVSVDLNGTAALGYVFNAPLADGGFGLLVRTGSASFDSFTVQTDDASLAGPTLVAASAGTGSGRISTADAQSLAEQAVQRWLATGLVTDAARLEGVQIEVTDLPGRVLGMTLGERILLDADAAGNGWFVDLTPQFDQEFLLGSGGVLTASSGDAYGRMDLLTALGHEFGHVLGFGHGKSAVMREVLNASERVSDYTATARPSKPHAPAVAPEVLYYFDRQTADLLRAPKAAPADARQPLFYFDRFSGGLAKAGDPSAGKQESSKRSEKVNIDWRGGVKASAKGAAGLLPKLTASLKAIRPS